jgi:hypothetical protein
MRHSYPPVRPELGEPLSLEHGQIQVDGGVHPLGRFPETDQVGHLSEELRVVTSGVDSEGEDGTRVTIGGDVNEMELGLASVALDAVVGGRVDVPARHVDGLVLSGLLFKRKVRESGKVALGVRERHCRAVSPVVKGPGNVPVVSGHHTGHMTKRETLVESQRDGRLLCSVLAQDVVGGKSSPVVGSLVGPRHVGFLGPLLEVSSVKVVLGAGERQGGEQGGKEGGREHGAERSQVSGRRITPRRYSQEDVGSRDSGKVAERVVVGRVHPLIPFLQDLWPLALIVLRYLAWRRMGQRVL